MVYNSRRGFCLDQSMFLIIYWSLAPVELDTVFVSSMGFFSVSVVVVLSVVSALFLSRSLLVVALAWLESAALSPEITVGVSLSCK